ncbi:GNAT family N-acetyltransferase [Breoghania sp. L-A4]|uniref:GNAT family N-acetyltransferase n=1 Tax=Breoghania sp. L-A4 TaxID=2304600 RepID=UPI000E35D3AA|nr:GNAT family N-acetyltransferase [Breoghania sp. L-A4]AXS41479.1 GNAT family N-acetyltransferase [Breoghania sp. L-A4]
MPCETRAGSSCVTLNLDGYTPVPAGKTASVVTYLEMRARPEPNPRDATGLSLHRVDAAESDWYRGLFRRIGADWLWSERLAMSEADLKAILADPAVEIYSLIRRGREAGMVELDFRDPENVELGYFGLVPEAIGSGAGRWMMEQALDEVWARPRTRRFWVHTCTLDAPGALGFYQACGFTPYKRAIEVSDDPRLAGLLPRDAAPQVPVL